MATVFFARHFLTLGVASCVRPPENQKGCDAGLPSSSKCCNGYPSVTSVHADDGPCVTCGCVSDNPTLCCAIMDCGCRALTIEQPRMVLLAAPGLNSADVSTVVYSDDTRWRSRSVDTFCWWSALCAIFALTLLRLQCTLSMVPRKREWRDVNCVAAAASRATGNGCTTAGGVTDVPPTSQQGGRALPSTLLQITLPSTLLQINPPKNHSVPQ